MLQVAYLEGLYSSMCLQNKVDECLWDSPFLLLRLEKS